MLKGGHEAPTKPKGRPKKNSIPTTEEIEAEERRMKAEAEERMKREAEQVVLVHGGEASQLGPQDLSSETPNAATGMEASEGELLLVMQSETQAAS